MGLEITQKIELNQYEAINHKSDIYLWLHQILEGVITPKILTVENLSLAMDSLLTEGFDELYAALSHNHDSAYAALSHNHDSAYAALSHDHDEAYAALTHDHDSDYASIDHHHDAVYARLATVSWSGNTSAATNRDINYTPAITPKIIMMLGWSTSSDVLGFLGAWQAMSTSIFHLRPNSNYLRAGILTNVYYETPSAGKLPLYSQTYNLTGYNYRGLIWGVET